MRKDVKNGLYLLQRFEMGILGRIVRRVMYGERRRSVVHVTFSGDHDLPSANSQKGKFIFSLMKNAFNAVHCVLKENPFLLRYCCKALMVRSEDAIVYYRHAVVKSKKFDTPPTTSPTLLSSNVPSQKLIGVKPRKENVKGKHECTLVGALTPRTTHIA